MNNNRYYQKCITFGRAAEGLRADFQEQLKEMQAEIGFEYVRFHGIFHDDMAIYSETEDGKPMLWFGYLDKLFDFLLEQGLKPMLELGFVPTKLATVPDTIFWWHANGCPPIDYEKWGFMLKGMLEHMADRYGLAEMKNWYFEVWNEPNLTSFWRGTQEEYFRLYETSVHVIKSFCKELKVGGPSTSGADFREDLAYLKDFIRFCSSKNLPVDFFSAHPYPTYWPLDTAGNKQMGYMGKDICAAFFSNIKNIVRCSAYPDAEIHLTEWNSSPSPRDLVHDTLFAASFILYNITQNFGKIDSLGYWAFTDIFEENGPGTQPFHGGFGLINSDGIKKSSYWAYWFLSLLGDEIIEITDKYIITRQEENYQIIVWNYCYYTEAFAQGNRSRLSPASYNEVFHNKLESILLTINLSGEYKQTLYILDEYTSALQNWINIGAPQYMTPAQVKLLKNQSRPSEIVTVISEFKLNIDLKPHEVRMFILSKNSAQDFAV